MNYDSIYISPSGVKGYSLLGSLKYLSNKIDLYNFDKYIGGSAGAILVFFLALEINIDNLIKELFNVDINLEKENNLILNLLNKKGLYSPNKIINLIKDLLIKENISPNIKFKDLKKNLFIITSDITCSNLFIFNNKDTPDDFVLNALRASISIPLFFEPYIYKNKILIDGGVYNMLKIKQINEKTLILNILGDVIRDNITSEYNLKNYMLLLLSGFLSNDYILTTKSENRIDFNINFIGTKFDLNKNQKKDLYRIGIDQTIFFCYKKELLLKYFNLIKNYILSVAVST